MYITIQPDLLKNNASLILLNPDMSREQLSWLSGKRSANAKQWMVGIGSWRKAYQSLPSSE
jgi:hypothetical protein